MPEQLIGAGELAGFASDPLGTMLIPFDGVFEGFSLVVFWALLIGILWLRTHNTMLVSVMGIAMVAAYMGTGATISPEMDKARMIGAVLIVVSLCFTLYYVIAHRPHMQPS